QRAKGEESGLCFRLSPFAFLLGCAIAASAIAQPYPSKPVRIVVASTPGGGSDFVGRFVAQRLIELLGQQVAVENRAGGAGTMGYEYGIKSAPDGYTLTIITATYTINPALYPVKFDPLQDFTPIVRVARGPYVIVVHPSLPARNVKDLIALARA